MRRERYAAPAPARTRATTPPTTPPMMAPGLLDWDASPFGIVEFHPKAFRATGEATGEAVAFVNDGAAGVVVTAIAPVTYWDVEIGRAHV